MKNRYVSNNRDEIEYHIKSDFDELPTIIKSICERTPYKNDRVMLHRLYVSCLLTFISSLTLSSEKIESLQQKLDSNRLKYEHIIKTFSDNDEIVL